ncbi:permease [Streptomyces sioyaensis]|uniref:permease n=1 Tax=Streptomyces sioyaensis TaxID=67364 RepID=UPI0037B2B9B6
MSTATAGTPRTNSSSSEGRHDGRPGWRLLRAGWAAGRGAPGDRLRFWAVFAAAAALALAAFGAVAAAATYDGRAARNQARGPVITDRPHEAVALWREGFDAVGEVPHTVLFIEPLKPGAPPPPGLARWPAPGEAMLSPELVRQGQQERITSRYGRYAGTIGTSGLVSPSERLAYVRPVHAPDAGARESWWPVRGFGRAYPTGEVLYARPLGQVLLTLGLLTGVPALVLLVVAARVGRRGRERRGGPLPTPGATWRQRALLGLGEAVLPAAAGTAVMLLPALAAMSTNLRIPPTGYLLDGGDLRAAWPVLAGALVLSFALTAGAVALLPPRAERHGTGPRALTSRPPRGRTAGCVVGVGLIAFSQYLSGTPGLVAFAVGTVVMWALLPSVAAAAGRRLGGALAARGLRAGRPGQLIAGRWTAAHPGGVVRLTLAMLIGLGLVCQLQVWNSRPGEKAAAARVTQARVGDSVLDIRSRDLTPKVIAALAHALPPGSQLLALTTDSERQITLVQGPCPALRSLGLGCPATPQAPVSDDARLTEIRHWYGPDLRVQATPAGLHPDRLRGSLVVLTKTPGQRDRVERAAYALVPAVDVATLGESWLVGGAAKDRLNNWLLLFGSLGCVLLLLAGGLSAAAEFRRARQGLVSLAALTGSHRVVRVAALWHLTVPLLLATAFAAAVTVWHCMFLIATMQGGSLPWHLLGAALCGCALVAVAAGVLCGRSAVRAARHWPAAG